MRIPNGTWTEVKVWETMDEAMRVRSLENLTEAVRASHTLWRLERKHIKFQQEELAIYHEAEWRLEGARQGLYNKEDALEFAKMAIHIVSRPAGWTRFWGAK